MALKLEAVAAGPRRPRLWFWGLVVLCVGYSCGGKDAAPEVQQPRLVAGQGSDTVGKKEEPDRATVHADVILEEEPGQVAVCRNAELLKFIKILKASCDAGMCDVARLEDIDAHVDKSVLLGTLRDPHLKPVHLFFPVDLYELDDVLDWNSTKQSQLKSLKLMDDPGNTIIFVLGKASPTGLKDYDRQLSYSRMKSVFDFITAEDFQCDEIRVGYFGHEVLQFDLSDSYLLNIPEKDYRGDQNTLNQAVHVFAYPCADMLPESAG